MDGAGNPQLEFDHVPNSFECLDHGNCQFVLRKKTDTEKNRDYQQQQTRQTSSGATKCAPFGQHVAVHGGWDAISENLECIAEYS